MTGALGAGFAQAESGRVIDQFIPDDLAAVDTQERIEARFGASEPAFVLFITSEPGAPELLRAIHALDRDLEDREIVLDVASITDHLGDVPSLSDAELRSAWNEANGRPDLSGQFIRDDATLVRVAFAVDLESGDITAAVDDAVSGIQLAGVDILPAGLAYVEQAQNEGGAQDVQYLVPLSVVAIAIILAFLFRRPSDVLIPIVTTFVALAWAYGILTWAQMPLSPLVFSVMPLILGLGVDYMLHIVYAFRETSKGTVSERFQQVGNRVGAPVFFTALTTLIGFGSFMVSKIPQVRSWGLLIGGGALAAFILGFLLLPALYRLSRPAKRPHVSTHRFLRRLGETVANNRWLVLLGLLLVTAGLGAAATQVNLERELETQVDPDEPASVALGEVEARFGGQSIAQFFVPRSVGPSGLEALEQELRDMDGLGFVDGPATRVSQGGGGANGYPTSDARLDGVSSPDAWLVTVGYETENERDILPLLEQAASEHGAELTGRGFISLEAEGAVLDSLLLSTGVAFGLVLLLLLFVFRKPVPALLAFTPLVLVIVWQLGIQAIFGIPLNSVTGITAAMVIGIGVDYSLHLMSDVQRSRHQGKTGWVSAVDSVTHVGQPVLAGTLTTVVAFTVLSFSQLSQLQQFGTVAAIVVACAFIASLGFIPAVVARGPRGPAPKSTGATRGGIIPVQPRFADPDVEAWYEESRRRD